MMKKLILAVLLFLPVNLLAEVVPTFSCKTHGRLVVCDAQIPDEFQVMWTITAYREQTYLSHGKQVKFLISKKLTTIQLQVLNTNLAPMICYSKQVKGKVLFGHHEASFK